jgi:hypothetical protein
LTVHFFERNVPDMPPPIHDFTENGHRYRIIIEQPNHDHPEGSRVGLYAYIGREGYKQRIGELHISLRESEDLLVRNAKEEAKGHAAAMPPGPAKNEGEFRA